MIEGVKVKKLKKIADYRGFLMEMLRDDDDFYVKFGQVYMTVCNPGIVKAWHYHKKQSDNFVIIRGKGRIGLYDGREGSKTKGKAMEFTVDENNPILVFIPPGVLHGYETIGNEPCYLINCVTEHYDYGHPDEHRVDPFDNDIPFKWNNKKGG
ncbi:dTDP-4-dehydrorhamnose 3,5-epimerase family protein [Candidatus Woesearchaeota archaeon]|nr:dTDP-4-dehydrorhamnose 3,5-epimerase family protein [Candidatus Woesearchaeota archaeon]